MTGTLKGPGVPLLQIPVSGDNGRYGSCYEPALAEPTTGPI